METKLCTGCGIEQPISEYYTGSPGTRYKDGHNPHCKSCCRQTSRDNRRDNPEYQGDWVSAHPEYGRDWIAHHPGYQAAATAFYRVKPSSQLKLIAREAVRIALQDGTLTRPATCTVCGGDNAGRVIEGHHGDYGLPLDVDWLCGQCHGILRRKILRENKAA